MTSLIRSSCLNSSGLLRGLIATMTCFSRGYKRLSYYPISGSTSVEEFHSYGQRLDQIVQETLIRNKIYKEMKEVKLTEKSENLTATSPNTVLWNSMLGVPVKVSSDCKLEILNSDKEVMIKLFWAMIQKSEIAIQERVAVLNEGADNGDYLGFVIPALQNSGASIIDVSLYNGNVRKLAFARAFSSLLVGSENVSVQVFDSFRSVPDKLKKLADYQHVHLPFRLVVVEEQEMIANYLKSRISHMKKGDVMLASFLHLDDKAEEHFSKIGFWTRHFQDHAIFEKPVTRAVSRILNHSGVKGENHKIVNTAYSIEGVLKVIRNANGRVRHMHITSTQTDDGDPISTVGVILTL